MRKLIEMPYGDSTVIVALDVPEEAVKEVIRKVGRETYFEDFTTPKKVDQDFGLIFTVKSSAPGSSSLLTATS
jgi:cellulose synthase/poly-beta-1,6-N-acetylglucosamine synthase-like glycosyltransferase